MVQEDPHRQAKRRLYRQFFTLAPTHHNTIGNSLHLYVSRSNVRVRQKFFSQRSVNDWNRLP